MAAPLSLTLLLFLASSISFILMLVFLYIKKRRRRSRREEEHEDSTAAWLAVAAPPPPPPPQMEGKEEAEAEAVSGEEKRRKKRGKKKRQGLDGGEDGSTCSCPERDRADGAGKVGEGGKVGDLPFPFSSFASATQRKIKVKYDELVRSNQAKALTMAQVGQFVNCLVEARNGLQHKSEIIQRSFKIKKALLFKADRSSFDRLCQQIYKLEAEQKRLEEDAAVYNLLQEQLKLSPAYKTMLEVGASMELKGPRDQAMEFSDISFEELLAREKKDSFWRRNGRLRSSAS